MKKIGIITYHFAVNYGAVLQCMSLQRYLQKKGYEVYVIDYVSDEQKNNNDLNKKGSFKSLIKDISLFPFYSFRKNKFNKFNTFKLNFLNLTRRVKTIDDLKFLINEMNFDYLISGSDQVFNPNIEDFDLAFLYPFKTHAKKISYAASLGNATNSDLQLIKKYLDDFYKISIREKNDLIKFNGISNDVSVVCDPVLLIDESEWESLANLSNYKLPKKEYVFVYLLHKKYFSKEFEIIKKISQKLNLDMVIINSRYSKYSFQKGTKHDVGPLDFLKLMLNSSFVCTDSFHGTVFSVIFNKKFICMDSKENKSDSRRLNFLEEIELSQNFHYVEDDLNIENLSVKKNDIKFNFIKSNAFKFLDILK